MLKIIFKFRTQWEANLAIAFLRQNGFHPIDLEVWPYITFAGAEQAYSVKIPEQEYEEAAELSRRGGYDKALTSK
jgi:hypothetical protein